MKIAKTVHSHKQIWQVHEQVIFKTVINKKANKKSNAAIIIIGNEVLSGRTQDVNVTNISLWLNKLGGKLEEVRIRPDSEKSIVQTVNQIRKKLSNFRKNFVCGITSYC